MKELFRFTRSERIASLIILVLTLAVLLTLAYVRRLRPLPVEEVRHLDSLITAAWPAGDTLTPEHAPVSQKKNRPPADEKNKHTGVPPVRDPNTMTREEWEALALPPPVIRTLLRYRDKGGVFRSREDVKKIYGMTDSLYEQIAPYLAVREVPEQKHRKEKRLSAREGRAASSSVTLLEINRADSAALDSLPGVPSFLARRIVRYRELLGGFVSTEQLREVYGLDSLTWTRIRKRITVDTTLLRKIDVNRCDEYTLARHPYLTRKDAGAVIFYREHFGRIEDLQVLKEQHVLQEETFRRILPYLQTGTGK